MTTLAVNLGGLILIGLSLWWFWGSAPEAHRFAGPATVEITVADGAYTPAHIQVTAGQTITLRFIRMDPSPCAEKVIFETLGISADLPMSEPRELTLTLERPGEYGFTCQMGMYRGRMVAC